MKPFPHPSDATHKIWSRLANWFQRYSSLKVWTTNGRLTTDGPLVYYKLTLWAFGSGELKMTSAPSKDSDQPGHLPMDQSLLWAWLELRTRPSSDEQWRLIRWWLCTVWSKSLLGAGWFCCALVKLLSCVSLNQLGTEISANGIVRAGWELFEPRHEKTCFFAICEQQRRRSACASAQSDHRFHYSLLR